MTAQQNALGKIEDLCSRIRMNGTGAAAEKTGRAFLMGPCAMGMGMGKGRSGELQDTMQIKACAEMDVALIIDA